MFDPKVPNYLSRRKYKGYQSLLSFMEGEGSQKLGRVLAASPGSGMGRPLDLPVHDFARQFRAEIVRIKQVLHDVVIIEDYVSRLEDKSCIDIGATVTLDEIDVREESRYTIVGADEASPSDGRISFVSPLGQALIGKKRKDKIVLQVSGAHFAIKRVEYLELDFVPIFIDWDAQLDYYLLT